MLFSGDPLSLAWDRVPDMFGLRSKSCMGSNGSRLLEANGIFFIGPQIFDTSVSPLWLGVPHGLVVMLKGICSRRCFF